MSHVVSFVRSPGGGRLRELRVWGDTACGLDDWGQDLMLALTSHHYEQQGMSSPTAGAAGGLRWLELRGLYLHGTGMEALGACVAQGGGRALQVLTGRQEGQRGERAGLTGCGDGGVGVPIRC